MARKAWKLFSLIIAFSIIIDSSSGSRRKNLKRLATANNDLGLKLYQILVTGNSENIFFSPFSISNAFGVLFAGAKKNTKKQLRSALGYDSAKLNSSKVSTAFDQYLEMVLPQNQSPNPEYTLNLANELLLDENFIVYTSYKNQVRDFFHAYVENVDFLENSDQILEEVNDWVNEVTRGKISELLSDLSTETKLLIINAIYFKGTWKTEFEARDTYYEDFYNYGSDSEVKEVPLMHLTSEFPYVAYDDLQVLELPYKGDNISMIVLLPQDNDGLTDLEHTITSKEILAIRNEMSKSKVKVTFPKFKVEYKRTMNKDFSALGATDMFNPDLADFTAITPNDGICVSDIIHKAVVEVNEEGSEAAAATSIGVRATAAISDPQPTPLFIADHPFMFAIMDNRNNMMLFLGRVNEL